MTKLTVRKHVMIVMISASECGINERIVFSGGNALVVRFGSPHVSHRIAYK